MPKLKTKSSLKKRFSRTGTGKIKFKPAGKRHGMSKRSNKFIRSTKRSAIMSQGDAGANNWDKYKNDIIKQIEGGWTDFDI